MKQIINYRPVVIFCIIMMLGIIIGYCGCVNAWYVFLLGLPILMIMFWAKIKSRLNVLYYLIALIVGFCITIISIKSYDENVSGNYQIYGKVSEIVSTTEYGKQTELSNIQIVNNNQKEGISGKAILYFTSDVDINIGDNIYFFGKVEPVSIIENNSINTYMYKYNYKYTINVSSDITVESTEKNLTDTIKLASYNKMNEVMSQEVTGISYAVLFGDRALVDDSVYSAFQDTGTAHILAVSGLHVSFLIALIYLLLSLCRVKGWYQFAIIFVVLLAYCYICNFAPSVLRASIMGLVVLLAKNIGRQQDMFSSIALSCILILLFRPLYLFDTGFLMSYGAVVGIMLLYRPISSIFGKNKIGKIIGGAVSVSLCAQLGILPITIGFGSLPIFSVMANVVVVPLFAVTYSLLCIINFIVLILPFMAFMYYIIEALMQTIIIVANFVASIPGNTLKIAYIGFWSIVLYYVAVFVISKFVMLDNNNKMLTLSIIALCGVVIYLIKIIPYNYIENRIVYSNKSTYTLVKTEDNYNILINFPTNQSQYDEMIKKLSKNGQSINTIIILPQNNYSIKNLIQYCSNNNIKVYLPSDHVSIQFIKDKINCEIISNDYKYTLGDYFDLRYLYENDYSVGCSISLQNAVITYVSNINDALMYRYDNLLLNSDYIITDSIDKDYIDLFEKDKISCYNDDFAINLKLEYEN